MENQNDNHSGSDGLEAKSTGGLFPHVHRLFIPRGLLAAPPTDGATLRTSSEYSLIFKHAHEVHLTQAELLNIGSGRTVVARDTDKGRHSFSITLT
jgi:hypothetical protein